MKFVNVGNALKVTCVGFAAGVVLRVGQMLFFFDYDTGFYTDGGLMAWLSFGVPVASGLLASWMCFRSRRYFGPYTPGAICPRAWPPCSRGWHCWQAPPFSGWICAWKAGLPGNIGFCICCS